MDARNRRVLTCRYPEAVFGKASRPYQVDHIRKKGNEANHEIVLMEKEDAEDLLVFSEMLLKFIYEFPKRVPPSVTAV